MLSKYLPSNPDSEIALVGKTPRMTANGMIGIAPMSNREPVRLAKLPDAQLRAKAEDVADGKLVEKEQTESSCEKAGMNVCVQMYFSFESNLHQIHC